MTSVYRTSNAFFVSSVGKRLQSQIASFFSGEDFSGRSAVLAGSVFPFLTAFERNNPDIVFEKEDIDPTDFFSSLPPAYSIDMAFISALNDSVIENLPSLIKEADRLLKPDGQLFLLIKKTKRFFAVTVPEIPETNPASFLKEAEKNGFLVHKKKKLLCLPYDGSFWQKADDFLFSASIGEGTFLITALHKQAIVTAPVENYKPTRITKASVLTSPRT